MILTDFTAEMLLVLFQCNSVANLLAYIMHTEIVKPAPHPCIPSPLNCTL